MTPDEFLAAYKKSRGMTLDSTPVVPPAVIPPTSNVVRTERIIPTNPSVVPSPPQPVIPPPSPDQVIRTNPDGTIAGNITSNKIDNPAEWVTPPVVAPTAAVAAAPPARVPQAFPAGGADAVPFSRPVVEPSQGGGLTLASNPVQGWAGSLGLPTTPEEAKAFDKGGNYEKLMSGLDDVTKGLKPKPVSDPNATVISPMMSQPNQPSQLSAQLMDTLLKSKMQPRGLTLAGRY